MTIFGDLPLMLQNFLSSWIDELINNNPDIEINRPELSETMGNYFDQFSTAFDFLKEQQQSELQEDGAPFHLTSGPDGLQQRSNNDHSMFFLGTPLTIPPTDARPPA